MKISTLLNVAKNLRKIIRWRHSIIGAIVFLWELLWSVPDLAIFGIALIMIGYGIQKNGID